jgi:predicted metal-dependent peptidase
LDRPFLGALALRLPSRPAANWCKTVATDAKALYYNPAYILDLSISQVEAVMAHEALHCALAHFSRRQHRNKARWDLACDFAINSIIVQEGMMLPPNALHMPDFDGMSAEEIYPMLDDNPDQEPQDQHVYDQDGYSQGSSSQSSGGSGQSASDSSANGRADSESDEGFAMPPPLNVEEKETMSTQWQQRMAGAAQQAQQSGKLSAEMARMVDLLLQSQVPWRSLLARYMSMRGRNDFNYHRPSRREGEAIFPSLRSAEVNVTIAIDTSGSISESEMQEFITEVDALKGQVKARITLLACDCELHAESPWRYEPWDEMQVPDVKGGGGTSFIPVFSWCASQDMAPDTLIYFTDAEGEFPAQVPHFPVIWLVKGKQPVPFGDRIQLN